MSDPVSREEVLAIVERWYRKVAARGWAKSPHELVWDIMQEISDARALPTTPHKGDAIPPSLSGSGSR